MHRIGKAIARLTAESLRRFVSEGGDLDEFHTFSPLSNAGMM
jgi:hypothetical protein